MNLFSKLFRKHRKKGYALLTTLLLGALLVWALDSLFPPDFSKADQLSVVVTDQHDALLHVYLSADEQWRLPTTVVPEDYRRLLLAYEDQRYLSHHGVDFYAFMRALKQNIVHRRVVSGASTISMQTARLLMPHPRSYKGKLIEMWRAWQIERRVDKTQLLKLYTTLAPMGGNIEGIRAASLVYFDQAVDTLSLGQYALLVALPQSPKYALSHPNEARDKVLKQALLRGAISQQEYDIAVKEPLQLYHQAMPRLAPHLADALKQQYPKQLHIQTTLDKRWQRSVETLLADALNGLDKYGNLSALILDNDSGEYRVYVGSAERSQRRQGYVDMLQAIRSPGSTLKPLITLLAFDRLNYHPQTMIADEPLQSAYRPKNYDGLYLGDMTLEEALILSRNIPAVVLLEEVGPSEFAQIMQDKAGLPLYLPQGARANLSMALGGVGIKAVALAQAYRQLALCSRGQGMLASEKACVQVTSILQKVSDEQGRFSLGASPIALKTGTAYGWRDMWVVGYNDDYTWLLWRGRADGGYSQTKASAEVLLPLFRQLLALTPNPPQTYRALPRYTEQRLSPYLEKISDSNTLRIMQPIDGATIAYQKNIALQLTVKGGKAPYLWTVNKQLQPVSHSHWQLPIKSSGIYQISVIDQLGESDHVKIRVLAPTPKNTSNHVELTPISH